MCPLVCLWEISNLLHNFKKFLWICTWLKLRGLAVCIYLNSKLFGSAVKSLLPACTYTSTHMMQRQTQNLWWLVCAGKGMQIFTLSCFKNFWGILKKRTSLLLLWWRWFSHRSSKFYVSRLGSTDANMGYDTVTLIHQNLKSTIQIQLGNICKNIFS